MQALQIRASPGISVLGEGGDPCIVGNGPSKDGREGRRTTNPHPLLRPGNGLHALPLDTGSEERAN